MTTTPSDPGPEPASTTDQAPEAPTGHADHGPRVGGDEIRDLGRLRRTTRERRVAGVAGGLARHTDLDPLVLRVAFVVLVFFGGAGLILYLAGWLLVPADDADRAVVRLDPRSRSVALLIAAGVAALALVGGSSGAFGVPWPLVVLGLVVLAVVASRPSTGRSPAPDTTSTGHRQGGGADGALTPYPAPVPVVDRGPLLFWFTLAGLAFSLGLLGVVDGLLTGDLPDGSYPALAVAVIGAVLMLGAFYGRPGGLVALGLVAALATAGATAFGQFEGAGSTTPTPVSAAMLAESYRTSAGEIVVDLSQVRDLDALDGRSLELAATVGRIEVLVPPGLDVRGDARVRGGEVEAFGETSTRSLSLEREVSTDAPTLTIDAEVRFGEIVVELTGRNRR